MAIHIEFNLIIGILGSLFTAIAEFLLCLKREDFSDDMRTDILDVPNKLFKYKFGALIAIMFTTLMQIMGYFYIISLLLYVRFEVSILISFIFIFGALSEMIINVVKINAWCDDKYILISDENTDKDNDAKENTFSKFS